MDKLHEEISARYARHALGMAADAGCCAADCSDIARRTGGYSAEELASVGAAAGTSLGCGNPTQLASLAPGEVVLDLGSGAGLDVLLSARRVAPGGHAYGVDMTDQMLALANANREEAGIDNATFLKGTIEALPLPDAAVDVVISNCVINLAADKAAAIREAFRVLRPGGRLAVSDMVALEEVSAESRRDLDLWAGCVAGTITREAYLAALLTAGFEQISIDVAPGAPLAGLPVQVASASIRARKAARPSAPPASRTQEA